MIEENSPVQMQEIMPVIDKKISSLCRNDQACSLLRHSKTHSKLASHAFNVLLSLMLAKKLGLSGEEQQLLGTAALLHDSGWAQLPSNLFSKGKLISVLNAANKEDDPAQILNLEPTDLFTE